MKNFINALIKWEKKYIEKIKQCFIKFNKNIRGNK